MSIRQLPDDVVDRLKSSVVITSLNGVASGLLKNSLDAGATKINITVDYSRGNCTVEDNGVGIPPEDFKQDGGLGKLHHTSRFPPNDGLYGRQGDFLASLATLSLLAVCSRHHRHVAHNSVLFHNSKVLARHLPAPPEQRLRAFDPGTRVIVRDLFGSMPVRVKQRAAMTSERPNVDREWQQLIVDVVAILLSWHAPSSVSLRESVSQREIRLRAPESSDPVMRTSRLLTQASLADAMHSDSWVPLSASAEHVGVKGCISTSPSPTRRAQFISIGIHPLSNDFGTNFIYEEVNKIFTNSSFGASDESLVRRSTRQSQGDDVVGNELRTRKGVERWPMFYFRIRLLNSTALPSIDDILDNRASDLGAILDLLKAICYGFLKKQHLRPRKVRMSTEESVFSTSKSLGRSKLGPNKRSRSSTGDHLSRSSAVGMTEWQRADSESPFDGWPRVKVGHATRSGNGEKHMEARTARLDKSSEKFPIGDDGQLLRTRFADAEENTDGPQEVSGYFEPVVSRDGGLHAAPETKALTETQEPTHESGQRRLTRRPKGEPSEWLKGVLESWNNPIFENAPLAIPRAYDDSTMPRGDASGDVRSKHFGSPSNECQVMFESGSMNLHGRISKAALTEAKVVAQVDRKFILVKLPLDGVVGEGEGEGGTSALVMLDQHAVDERCQLEDLMDGYFDQDAPSGILKANVEILERPLRFEIDTHEGGLLRKYLDHFGTWGIQYQVEDTGASREDAVCSVRVDRLPPSVLERCRTEPRLLINLLREEVWKLAEGEFPSSIPPTQTDLEDPSSARFHGCPRGILELLHSRSCRSAVMFNDVLTRAECEQMARRVAGCAFPFQCAHGRPSMAPLVDLGVGHRIGGWMGDEQAVDWKRWVGSGDPSDIPGA